MKTKVRYFEYDCLSELLKRAESFVYCTAYNGFNVYFVPMSSYTKEIFFHFYMTDTLIEGYVSLDKNNEVIISKSGDSMKAGYIPIIYLKNTSFIGEFITEYQKKNAKSV